MAVAADGEKYISAVVVDFFCISDVHCAIFVASSSPLPLHVLIFSLLMRHQVVPSGLPPSGSLYTCS